MSAGDVLQCRLLLRTFNRLISQNLETSTADKHPRWSLIAFYLFSFELSFSAVSVKKMTRICFSLSHSQKNMNPLNHNIGLTVSCRSVLRVQDAWFLEGPDAGVHQLQACCQLLLDVLVSICICTNEKGKRHELKQRLVLPPPDSYSIFLHSGTGHKSHSWLD